MVTLQYRSTVYRSTVPLWSPCSTGVVYRSTVPLWSPCSTGGLCTGVQCHCGHLAVQKDCVQEYSATVVTLQYRSTVYRSTVPLWSPYSTRVLCTGVQCHCGHLAVQEYSPASSLDGRKVRDRPWPRDWPEGPDQLGILK